jgi:hypothetical protein
MARTVELLAPPPVGHGLGLPLRIRCTLLAAAPEQALGQIAYPRLQGLDLLLQDPLALQPLFMLSPPVRGLPPQANVFFFADRDSHPGEGATPRGRRRVARCVHVRRGGFIQHGPNSK